MGTVIDFPPRGSPYSIRVYCFACKKGYVVEPAVVIDASPNPDEVQCFYSSDTDFCRHCGGTKIKRDNGT